MKQNKCIRSMGRLLWVLLIVLCNFNVQASNFWKIRNQMKKEIRPYTKTPLDPSVTGPTFMSSRNRAILPRFRDLHRYCDGQCFYAPATCDSIGNIFGPCRIAASIATHNEDRDGELYCEFLGPDNLRQSFCSKSKDQMDYQSNTGQHDRFYTITLHRTLDDDSLSCIQKWNLETGRKCRRSEFIGISFINGAAQTDLELEDLWYICTVDETHLTRISMWTNIDGINSIGQQIMGTKPHLESGAGVVFSKVAINEDTLSMGCQFIIQESNMTLRNPPANAAFFGSRTNPITIKLAGGFVERDPSADDTIIRPFFDNGNPVPYEVYYGNDLKPTDTIFFNSIQVSTKSPVLDVAAEEALETSNAVKIKQVIEKCDKPANFPHLYIACYPPNYQLNCVHTGRCPVMFIVEIPRTDTSFDVITAHLNSLVPDSRSLRKVKRPTGFASVGFSTDREMGREVVISCHVDGRNNVSVVVSINYLKTNVYPGLVDYSHLVFNTQTYATVEKSRILCSWQMKTEFVVNMFAYAPDYIQVVQTGQTEKLEYNFKTKPIYLLTVAGNRIYPRGKIVHHDFRQILDEQFSRDLFLKKAKGHIFVPNVIMLISLNVLIFLSF